jgi:sodium transport system ATP-binding protein
MIEIHDLHKSFASKTGPVRAVAGVSLRAEDGQITGLLGPNGAGKTTTLRMLYTLMAPDAGTVSVDGFDSVRQAESVRRRLGVLPDARGVYKRLTARENIAYFGRLHGLSDVQIAERTASLSAALGMEDVLDRQTEGFSQGQRTKTAIARALVHDPRNVVLDEPTNGLDPAGRDEMLALVRRTGTEFGIAVVVASHLLGEIERVCDFLVAIDAGRLLRAAPLGAFTERTGVLAIEVEEGEAQLTAALNARGLQAVADGRTVLIAVEDDRPYDIVRDAVAELGLPLVRLEQRRQSLEDLFRDDVPVGGGGPQ